MDLKNGIKYYCDSTFEIEDDILWHKLVDITSKLLSNLKNIFMVLPTFILAAALFLISNYLLYYFAEGNIIILVLSILSLLIITVFNKLLFASLVLFKSISSIPH